MMKAVQYGAGNIGRGFMGQLFFQSGYEVVFVEVNKDVVNKLNEDRSYPIEIMSEYNPGEIIVKNVRAVDGTDIDRVSDEIADADLMATAVGVNILPRIVKPIAAGLKKRWERNNLKPLNIIICENLLNADQYLAELLKGELSEGERKLFDSTIGLVEASIGRMVPVMTPEMQKGNILRVCVEEYCELPVDRNAFRGEIPNIVNMVPFSPFEFYIQRKLFIHNMGHALTAYLGYLRGYQYVWEANRNPYIKLLSSRAMQESAIALSLEHNVSLHKVLEHVEDLLFRFGNRYLGDTVERVGKDPIRKLSPNDRLVGAAKLCLKHKIDPVYISLGIAAAFYFNISGDQYAEKLQGIIARDGIGAALREVCGLTEESPIWPTVAEFHKLLGEKTELDAVLALAEKKKNLKK